MFINLLIVLRYAFVVMVNLIVVLIDIGFVRVNATLEIVNFLVNISKRFSEYFKSHHKCSFCLKPAFVLLLPPYRIPLIKILYFDIEI